MTRAMLSGILTLLLAASAHAQADQIDLPLTTGVKVSPVWSEVPSLNSADVTRLLQKIAQVATLPADRIVLSELMELQRDLTRQTESFKEAYRVSQGADPLKLDDETLFQQVFDGKRHTDPRSLQAIVQLYETIDNLVSKLVIARSIPKTGFQTYHPTEDRSRDSAQVAAEAEQRMASYASALSSPTQELRRLLALDSKH